MNTKKLKLNRSSIENTIHAYIGKEITPTDLSNAQCKIHRYEIEPNSLLDVYFNSDSTTTLLATGKHKESAQLIAEEIVSTCTVDFPNPTRALYLKKVSQTDLAALLQKLEGTGYVLGSITSNTTNTEKYEVTNTHGENIKIHYFPTTGALNFQGKGYSIYSDIILFFGESITLKDVIEPNLRANNIEDITTDELISSMQKSLPTAYKFIKGPIANIIASSFFLTKIENENLPDYSWMVFPLLRGLEGVIKKFLSLKGLQADKNFSEIFGPASPGSAKSVFLAKHAAIINDNKYCSVVEECYNYFKANRHGLLHIDNVISSTRNLSKEDALDLFNEIIELIELSYIETHP